MQEEREIDLIDLFAEVLRHWKGAIVCFLIGALALGIYGYIGSSKEVVEAADVQDTEMTFAEQKAADVALEFEALYVQAKDSGDIENLLELNKAIIESVKGFNDKQLKYFMENSISDLWCQSLSLPMAETNRAKMSMKMIIIGGLVASLLYCMFWAIKYVFDGHIKTSDDMMQLAGISQLGKIITDKAPAFFADKWIFRIKHHGQRLMDVDRSIELIASVIAVNAKSQEVEKIAFAGCSLEGKTCEYCKKLTELLKSTYQIEATILDDVIYNQNAVEVLAESKCVVLIETAGTSLYNDFYKEIQLIKQLGIKALGGVIVE